MVGFKSGTLYKYRPWAEGVFKDPWARRFLCLVGPTLQSYRSEHDGAHLPRSSVTLDERCSVRLEGWKRRRYWTWSVLDGQGGVLARLSSTSAAEGEAWVAALQKATGCASEASRESEGLFGRQPPPPPLANAAAQPLMRSASSKAAESAAAAAAAAEAHARTPHPAFSGLRGSTPVHREPRYSPLSSERLLYSSHAGFVNLVCIVLCVNHARLILENLGRYGVRVRKGFWVTALGLRDAPRAVPVAVAFLALALFPLMALLVERGAARARTARWESVTLLANVLNTAAVILMPWAVIHYTVAEPLPGFILLSAALVLWMKLVSFAHANADLRHARRAVGTAKKQDDAGASTSPAVGTAAATAEDPDAEHAYAISYPDNLSLGNLAYFIAAPTLCYQPSYPRSPRFRGRWLVRRVGELLLFGGLMALIIEQYMLPAVSNSAKALFESRDPLQVAERLLKLSVPTLYVWLCIFYCFFHCWLNILGELLRFGDRQFYREWWNATSIEQYWRLWNLPVHKWLARHLYFPAMRAGFSKQGAMLVTFAFSAVLHELLVGVPCHVFRLWAFGGIMAQLPLISLTNWTSKKLKNDAAGNIVFWLSFCIFGQPMAVLLYYRDYMATITEGKGA